MKMFLCRRGGILRFTDEEKIREDVQKYPAGSKEREGAERILALQPGEKIEFQNSGAAWMAFDETTVDELAQYATQKSRKGSCK